MIRLFWSEQTVVKKSKRDASNPSSKLKTVKKKKCASSEPRTDLKTFKDKFTDKI